MPMLRLREALLQVLGTVIQVGVLYRPRTP